MLIKLPLLKIKDGYEPDGYLIRGRFPRLIHFRQREGKELWKQITEHGTKKEK